MESNSWNITAIDTSWPSSSGIYDDVAQLIYSNDFHREDQRMAVQFHQGKTSLHDEDPEDDHNMCSGQCDTEDCHYY